MDVAPHASTQAWTTPERTLYARIEAHAFEDAGTALDFTRRLAARMDWPLATARAAIAEYRKYCFLAMVTKQGPVTPSEEVDEVWHLHLTYTRDYWERWCGEALGRALHHDPTAGGPAEAARHRAQYAETLALYERYFGPPPAAFWPGTAQRFAARPRYRLVDGARKLVVARPTLRSLARVPMLWTLPVFVTAPPVAFVAKAAAVPETDWTTTWNVLDWSGPPFLELFLILLVASIGLAILLHRGARGARTEADASDLDAIDIAYLRGGGRRATDTLVLEMAVRHAASLDKHGIEIGAGAGALPPRFEPFRSLVPARYARGELVKTFKRSTAAAGIRDELVGRNFLQGDKQLWKARRRVLFAMAPVLVLGVAKIAVGVSRDRPVGDLVGLTVMTIAVLVVQMTRTSPLTSEGELALATLRTRHDRLVRAPRQDELSLAFAFIGTAALAGSAFADYATLAGPGMSGFGTGCGGGCGGGGCGGCGS